MTTNINNHIQLLYSIRFFNAGIKLDAFYNLLVKECMSSDEASSLDRNTGEHMASTFIENRKDVLELSQKFLNKTNFYSSYLSRTILDVIVSVGMLVYLGYVGLPVVLSVRCILLYNFHDLLRYGLI